jgi:hypothetical protein
MDVEDVLLDEAQSSRSLLREGEDETVDVTPDGLPGLVRVRDYKDDNTTSGRSHVVIL